MAAQDLPSKTRRGMLVVLSSPSGAGKSTLTRRLLAEYDDVMLSISATTRRARPGEADGTHYFFVSQQEFDDMVSRGDMLETAQVFENSYGSPREPVERAIVSGRDVLFDVDWQGAQQLRQSALRELVVSIFLLPPSIGELERRLYSRAADDEDVIARRMSKAFDEISHWAEYDYVLINDDLERCYSEIETIIAAERLRRDRQNWLLPTVDRLKREFQERKG